MLVLCVKGRSFLVVGISFKPSQSLKSKVVKELKLPNASGISFKPSQMINYKEVKEVKLPNTSGMSFKPL